MEFVFLVVGLAMIVKSADILIESTSKIAKKYGVSTFVIGITVIAFGTSAPELIVGLVSGISKTNQLTLGNIVGSAISNTALIVGLSAIILPLSVKDTVIKREIPMLIGVQIVLAFMVLADGKLSRIESVILLFGFVAFVLYIIIGSKKTLKLSAKIAEDIDTDRNNNKPDVNPAGANPENMVKLYVLSAVSLIGLLVGGKLTVDNSSIIAANLGLNETIIGLTVIATATTLPELITGLMAVRKNEPDIVLGNCIGSNLFNILLVLGISALINPIPVQGKMLFDVIIMIALTLLVFVVSLFIRKIPRLFGVVLVLSHLTYICFKVLTAF